MDHIKERGIDWATAKELAMEVGYPWRAVARTLIYMARRNDIEQDFIEWRSSRHRMRRCYVYRSVLSSHATFPTWMMPQFAVQVDTDQYAVRLHVMEG